MRMLLALLTFLLLALPAAAQDKKQVDLALAMAIDISGSIDPDEAHLQREGYVQAFRDPVIVKAILGGANGRIAVAYYEWSDAWVQRTLIEWTLLDSAAAIEAFASRLAAAPISIARRTSISGAIDYARLVLLQSPFTSSRRVIDVSGDGANNIGRPVTFARDEAVRDGITINGLPILAVEPDLDTYYFENVIGGPGAVMVPAENFENFADAILKKLIIEIAANDAGAVKTSMP